VAAAATFENLKRALAPGLSVAEVRSILLPNDQRQHCTLHIQKDVLPYALC
jgi:hypothetical protein